MNNVSRFPFLLHDLYIYALLTLIRQYDLKYRIFFKCGYIIHGDYKMFIFLKFYFIFKLYNIVLVFPNIKKNPPQVYLCSPS